MKIHAKFHCSWFTEWNNKEIIKDDCPFKVEKIKPCIKRGEICKNLMMELL